MNFKNSAAVKKIRASNKNVLLLSLSFALSASALNTPLTALADEPLKGNVQELGATEAPTNLAPIVPMSAPVLKKRKPLAADAQDNGLKGNAQEDDGGRLRGQTGAEDSRPLQGSASASDMQLQAQDADSQDQEMAVEWDKWRNRLLRSIQSGVQELINNPENMVPHFDQARGRVILGPKIPLGQKASFFVRVSNDRRVTKARITASSGNPEFDNALLDAIYALDGSTILRFPKGSQRERVNQEATIVTADHGENEYFKFGDVEKYRVPSQ